MRTFWSCDQVPEHYSLIHSTFSLLWVCESQALRFWWAEFTMLQAEWTVCTNQVDIFPCWKIDGRSQYAARGHLVGNMKQVRIECHMSKDNFMDHDLKFQCSQEQHSWLNFLLSPSWNAYMFFFKYLKGWATKRQRESGPRLEGVGWGRGEGKIYILLHSPNAHNM